MIFYQRNRIKLKQYKDFFILPDLFIFITWKHKIHSEQAIEGGGEAE